MSYAILVDVTRCVGCGQCVEACREANGHPLDDGDQLSAQRYNVLQTRPVGDGDERYVRRSCMHCLDPACVSVCPVAAFRKTEEGAVVYDPDRCMGCRYCLLACPFGVPTYEWNERAPKVQKCFMCYERLQKGEQPACAAACPAEATVFGTREDLLKEAHRRIRENPDLYVPAVYGEAEAGGTSLLYVSDVPFEELGLPTGIPTEPLPGLTFKALEKIPALSLVWGSVLAGTWWIVGRRMTLQKIRSEGKDPEEALASDREGGR